MKTFAFLCLIFLSEYVNSANIRVDPLVLISQGLVKGLKSTDGSYSTFLGVPYAKVDLDNPFGSALPAEHFKETIFQAYNGDYMCPQVDAIKHPGETLDCLRLNVYVPSSASTLNPLPVMIWIHGGDFETGSGFQYDPKHLVKHGIVVVTINYRLGPYGFMCLNTPNVPGNQGLRDQFLALKWVRENIAAFGGNPYEVTIAGESAGAISALLHLYSSKDKLYKRVIAQSGTPVRGDIFVEGDVESPKKLALHLGFNATDLESALQFLITTSPDLVTGASVELGLSLRPCVEKSFSGIDNFVESGPFSLSNPKKVKNTPIMIGHTSVEYTVDGLSQVFPKNYFDTDPFYRRLQSNFNLDEDKLHDAADIVRHFYIGDASASEKNLRQLEDFESDYNLNHPTQKTITNFIKENASPVYEYMFSYIGDTDKRGASHTEELAYLFDEFEIRPKTGSDDDDLITDRMTTLWTNFVKHGNPIPEETSLLPVTWPPVTESERPYLNIDRELTLENRVYNDRMAFWDLFMKLYGGHSKLMKKCFN